MEEIKMYPYKEFWIRVRYDIQESPFWEVADREDRRWNVWVYNTEVYNIKDVIEHIRNEPDYQFFLKYQKDNLEKLSRQNIYLNTIYEK